ncbi:hypothetical protein C8R47DRAFT_297016 [Mycena vitilis]|nr:hypothetical protein C8R47DRAFT_297016 [Mycena vitilis]
MVHCPRRKRIFPLLLPFHNFSSGLPVRGQRLAAYCAFLLSPPMLYVAILRRTVTAPILAKITSRHVCPGIRPKCSTRVYHRLRSRRRFCQGRFSAVNILLRLLWLWLSNTMSCERRPVVVARYCTTRHCTCPDRPGSRIWEGQGLTLSPRRAPHRNHLHRCTSNLPTQSPREEMREGLVKKFREKAERGCLARRSSALSALSENGCRV